MSDQRSATQKPQIQALKPATDPADLRVPQNPEAEISVLGSMMLAGYAIDTASELLRSEDFFMQQNRVIFDAIMSLANRGIAVDFTTLPEELRVTKKLEAAGGLPYLASVLHMVPTPANVEYYARIVQGKAILRSLIGAGAQIQAWAYDTRDREVADLLARSEELIGAISPDNRSTGPEALSSGLPAEMASLDKISQSGGEITGVKTGFANLDSLTSGLQKQDFIVVGGRPSMGKSVLALDIAMGAAESVPVLFFSLEMSRSQLYRRILASGRSGYGQEVDGSKIRTPSNMSADDWGKIAGTVDRLYKLPLWIDDTPGMTVSSMRSRARRIKSSEGLGLVVVDYMQLIRDPNEDGNANADFTRISRDLKEMARQLDCPVLCLSQLSRNVEHRNDKRPVLSDLRESGTIEAAADIVMFVYRDWYYNHRPDEDVPDLDPTELLIRKHRNGPIGTVRLLLSAKHQTFKEAAPYGMTPDY